MVFGIMYFEYSDVEKNGKKGTFGYRILSYFARKTWVRRALYAISITLVVGYVNFVYPQQKEYPDGFYANWALSFYNATNKLVFVTMVFIIIAGPLVGKGSFTKKILSAQFWAPFSKVTF